MSFNYSPKIINDSSLVFYLDAANNKSYPKSGTTWNDISKGANTATLTNGPSYSSTNNGNIVFDGVDDFCSTTLVRTFTNMTIQVWFYKNGASVSVYSGLVASRGGAGGNITGLLINGGGSECLGYNWNDAVNTYSWNSGLVLRDNAWNFLSLTVTPTLATGFLNGVSATNTVNHASTTIANLAIGKDYSTERLVRGSIGLVFIYDKALSALEVLQNYNATKTRYGL
jgi:hypothetical protein